MLSEDICTCHHRRSTTVPSLVEVRDAAKHPTTQTDPTTNDYLAPNATAEKPGPVTICSFSAALIGAGIDGLGAGVPY